MNRAKLIELLATMEPCAIGLEACSGAHQLASIRELWMKAQGYT
jgi:tRNA(Arg) A34 adenosine deaminase TadA